MKFKILIPVYNDWQSLTKLLNNIDNEIEFVTGDEWKAGNLSYHLKSRPKWEGYTNDDILNNSSEFICIDDVCLGRY